LNPKRLADAGRVGTGLHAAPGTQEAKNNPISLIWGLGKASRNRLLKRAANDPDYKAVADGDNAEGWSKWLP
jgi:hypothetical protein